MIWNKILIIYQYFQYRQVWILTFSQTSHCFYISVEQVFLKTLWEKEKLLITSNFSFSHYVFCFLESFLPFPSNLELLSAISVNLEESKICRLRNVKVAGKRIDFSCLFNYLLYKQQILGFVQIESSHKQQFDCCWNYGILLWKTRKHTILTVINAPGAMLNRDREPLICT